MWPSIFIALLYVLIPSAHTQESCRTPLGTSGICINLKKCNQLMTALRSRPQDANLRNYLRNSLCGYEGNEPKICCRLSDLSNEYTEDTTSKFTPLQPPECGLSNVTLRRIVGGQPTKLGNWPWLTALGYKSRNPQRPNWLCGGALISKQHVLTAAHCINQNLYLVRIGDLDLENDNDGAQPFQDYIQSVTMHPNYNAGTHENDIAVLKTTNKVPFTSVLHPICLPVDDKNRNRNLETLYAMIAGWGSTSFRGPSSRRLLHTQLPITTEQTCKQVYRQFSNSVIDKRVLCAGFVQGGKDTCQGDSGGPLMMASADNQNVYHVIGVVSYGYRCAEAGYPGVYTRVTSFLDFILGSMK